eukprot:6077335-Amphidinium_carterae.1
MDGQPMPMQSQTAYFPNSTGPRNDCGQVDSKLPPPGLGTPKPNGMKPQTPSAAAASPVPNLQPKTGRYKDISPLVSRQTILKILL